MRITIDSIVSLAVKATAGNRLYLASLGSLIADSDDIEPIKDAIENRTTRDWYSDRMIAEWGWNLADETGHSCPAMWSAGFKAALGKLAKSLDKSESETFMAGIAAHDQGLTTKILKAHLAETETETDPLANIERAIVMLTNECPKVDAMALEAIRARLLAI